MDSVLRNFDRQRIAIQIGNLSVQYPHNVLVYNLPPTQDITLQMFEELAMERLAVLRILDNANGMNLHILSDDWRKKVITELNHTKCQTYMHLIEHTGTRSTISENILEARRNDYISHFILRLAYCRSNDLQNWFIARELELFKLKFSLLSVQDIKQYMEINQLKYKFISEDEKRGILNDINGNSCQYSAAQIELLELFRVHYTEVPDLIRTRKCYLKKGFAYVSIDHFIDIIANIHEACIKKGLIATMRILPEIEKDERIFNVIKGLHESYIGENYSMDNKDKVCIENIDQLSKKSFPLCMQQCHGILRNNHYLQHSGRQQYGLFLKGIGVTLEDSMK